MKKTKILGLLSVALVVLSLLTIISLAASDSPNYSYTVDKEEVKAGDVITLVVKCDEMTVSTSGFEIDFDKDALELTSTVKARVTYYDAEWESDENKNFTIVSTQQEANNTGHIGAAFIGTSDVTYYSAKQVCKLTFKVKDGASGTTTIAVSEESSGADGYKGAIGTTTLTIAAAHTCEHDHYVTENNAHQSVCACGENIGEAVACSGGTATCVAKAVCSTCEKVYGDVNADNHAYPAAPTSYNNDGATHTETYVCGNACGTDKVVSAVAHSYTNGACVCGAVETFTLTVEDMLGDSTTYTVPYGTNVLAYLGELVASNVISTSDINVNTEYEIGVTIFLEWCVADTDTAVDNDAVITSDFGVWAATTSTGWAYSENGWYYQERGSLVYTDTWANIDGAWYYLDEDGCRAEGVSRVPYPTVAINGVTYEADAETIDYCDANGTTFIDEETALFVFGEDGKFQGANTGLITYKDATRYVENGMLTWHPGFVTVGEELYYFIGDEANGGNIVANGETYIIRDNGNTTYKYGDIVVFVNGQIKAELNGIVDGYYYEAGELAYGKGLTKLGDNYIYVRSNGQVAANRDYYIVPNDLGVAHGLYSFDENGYMINPVPTDRNGIVDGYYYENGIVIYGAGLIELDGDIYYVRSNGEVATGTYYITNVANYEGTEYKAGDKLVFAEDGKLIAE